MDRQLISHFASARIECADLFFHAASEEQLGEKKDLKGLGHSAGLLLKILEL